MTGKFNKIIKQGILVFIFFLPILSPLACIGLVVALVLWLAKDKRKFLALKPNSFWLAVLGLAFCVGLSAVLSIDKLLSLSRFPFFIVCLLTCALMSHTDIKGEKILKAFILSGIIVTLIGIIQYFTKFNLKIETELFTIGMTIKGGISSTMSNPNRFAQYLVMVIPLGAAFLFKEKKPLWRTLAGTFLIFALICLYWTKSLAGMGAVFILLMAFIVLKNWKLGIGLILILTFLTIPNRNKFEKILSRFTTLSLKSTTRKNTWEEIAIPTFKKYPLTGSGFSTYSKVASGYTGKRKVRHGHAHSLYFHYLSETGILGLGSFIFVLLMFFRNSLRNIRSSPIVYGCSFSILGALIAGLTGTILEFLPLALLFWTIIGIGIKEYNA